MWDWLPQESLYIKTKLYTQGKNTSWPNHDLDILFQRSFSYSAWSNFEKKNIFQWFSTWLRRQEISNIQVADKFYCQVN